MPEIEKWRQIVDKDKVIVVGDAEGDKFISNTLIKVASEIYKKHIANSKARCKITTA